MLALCMLVVVAWYLMQAWVRAAHRNTRMTEVVAEKASVVSIQTAHSQVADEIAGSEPSGG